MPYPDGIKSDLGGPYFEGNDNEDKANEDQVKIEKFCDALRSLGDSIPELIDGLHFGSEMVRLRDVQSELTAIAEEIQRYDIETVLWEVCE